MKNGDFSIVMLNYQRVVIVVVLHSWNSWCIIESNFIMFHPVVFMSYGGLG